MTVVIQKINLSIYRSVTLAACGELAAWKLGGFVYQAVPPHTSPPHAPSPRQCDRTVATASPAPPSRLSCSPALPCSPALCFPSVSLFLPPAFSNPDNNQHHGIPREVCAPRVHASLGASDLAFPSAAPGCNTAALSKLSKLSKLSTNSLSFNFTENSQFLILLNSAEFYQRIELSVYSFIL